MLILSNRGFEARKRSRQRWPWLYSSYTAVNDFNALIILISGREQSGSRPRLALKVRRVSRGVFRTTNIGFHHAI
jgi:hypothetical protein